MNTHFALPYNLTTANFFVSAYQDLAMMVIDGVAQQIAYTDVHTTKVTTWVKPTQHVLGEQVPVVIVDTEVVELGVPARHAFNCHFDSMFSDIELQCAFAEHKSWHFCGELITKHEFLGHYFASSYYC